MPDRLLSSLSACPLAPPPGGTHSVARSHSTAVPRPTRRWAAWLAVPLLCFAGGAWAQSADLVLSNHVVTPDPVPAGGIATITMTVENNGTGSASNVKLTDTVPAGATFVSMTASDGGACTGAAPYECTWGSIPFPGTRTVTLRMRLPSAAVWPNSATVTSATADPNTGNNTLSRNITVQQAANLGITASTSAVGTIAAGTPYTYTLTVDNNGGPDPLPAGQSPTVRFNVPAGSSITSRPTGTGWTCTPASGYPLSDAPGGPVGAEITCTRNDGLAMGASFPPITVNAVANVTGTVTGTFDVLSNYLDGDGTNNTATVDVVLSDGTDMRITKTSAVSADAGGTLVTFTLTPRQEGGAAPTGVVVTDTLNAGFSYVDHTAPSPWVCDFGTTTPNTLTCSYPGIYNGGPFTNLPAITLRARPTGTGTVPNTGIVTATPPDPVGSNNSSTVNVSNEVDLGVEKWASIRPVHVGQNYNWVVRVRNYGLLPVFAGQTITVTDQIPAGVDVTASPSDANWTCSSSAGATYPQTGPLVLTCQHTRASSLAVNSNAPDLVIPAVNTGAGAVTNNVCLGSDMSGINGVLTGSGPGEAGTLPLHQANCWGADQDISLQQADLQITKTVGPDPVVVGQDLTYTLVVRNNSATVDATNTHVYDTVNNLITAGGLQSVVTSQGSCTPTSGSGPAQSIDCNLGTLAANGTATITIVVRPANTTAANLSRGNTASVNSLDVGDPNRGNNSSTVSSVVQPRVDATVSKTVNPSTVRVGQPMVYTVTASNAGPSTANVLTITDVMPPNTAFISVGTPSNGGTCSSVPTVGAGGTLTCSWANVAAGGNRTVTFTVRPLAAALNTTITNTVNVAVGPTDVETNTANNSGSINATVIASELDILVQKTDSVDPVPLGSDTTYTITIRNAGPSYGTNLVMADTFPNAGNTARFSYQGHLAATVAGAAVTPSCTEPAVGATSGMLRCTFPSIGIGAANEIVLTYRMRAESIITAGDYSGTQGNHVVVAVDETETQMANNQVDEDTTTRRDAIATDLALTKDIDKPRIQPGGQAVYTLKVTNNGPLPSIGAQVIDPLPSGLSFVSSADGCVDSAGTVSCAVGSLAVGASRTFTFTVRLANPYTGPGRLVNTARLDAPGDTNPGNNHDNATTLVPGREVASVPTLSEWGLIALSALLGWFALRRMPLQARRRL